jgi:hypothetical protein
LLVRVVAPNPIVDPVEARERLRLDRPDYDLEVEANIAAATAEVDATGWLGRALMPQTWELRLSSNWDNNCRLFGYYGPYGPTYGIRLPLPALIEVESITYRDEAGDAQAYASENYVVSGIGSVGFVSLVSGSVWPTTWVGPEALTIRFRCGYEDETGNPAVPENAKTAIILKTQALFDGNVDADRAANALLAPLRFW